MLSRLIVAALWSPAGKGLTYLLSFVFVTFSCGILGQVWFVIVFIDSCTLPPFLPLRAVEILCSVELSMKHVL